jgi:hypothetical protein
MTPDRARLFREAFIAGVIGYLAVAVFFVIWNLLAGRPALYTANLLGQGIVRAQDAGGEAVITFGPIVAYNAMHLIVFLLIGLLAAVLVFATEKAPQFWFVALLIFVTALMASISVVVVYAVPISDALPWWSIVAANVFAAVLMGTYLVRAHPRLLAEIAEIH